VPFDSKVADGVLGKIAEAKGALLPSTSAPQVVIDLLPTFDTGKAHVPPKTKRKKKLRKTPLKRMPPIGLMSVDPEGCLNALMQFMLFIPGFAESFYFAPRSFTPFLEFIEQYTHDQQEKNSVSSANGGVLFRFLSHKLEDLSLHEIFQFLLRSLYLKWVIYPNLTEALNNGRPTDLFLSEKSMKKQVFTQPDFCCYELDAFIELRSDGVNVNFVTFVKLEGSWSQCDDERITHLRSNQLNGSLQRSVLLHYKKLSTQLRPWNLSH